MQSYCCKGWLGDWPSWFTWGHCGDEKFCVTKVIHYTQSLVDLKANLVED